MGLNETILLQEVVEKRGCIRKETETFLVASLAGNLHWNLGHEVVVVDPSISHITLR